MYCNKCGNYVDENSGEKFCSKCGNDLTEALNEIRAKKAMDALDHYDELVNGTQATVAASQVEEQAVQQPVEQAQPVQQTVQQTVAQPVGQAQPTTQTQTNSQTKVSPEPQKKKTNTGVVVAICVVVAVLIFGLIGFGIKTLVGGLIGKVVDLATDTTQKVEQTVDDIEKKAEDIEKKADEVLDPVENKSDKALAKEEKAKEYKKNGKRVGSKDYGFVTVPKDWVRFQDVDGNSTLQYSTADASWIATLFAIDASQADALTYASAIYSSLEEEGVEELNASHIAINDYSAYQVYCYYPDEDIWLFCWLIDGKENDKTYYIAVEGDDSYSDYFSNIVLTFGENE